MNAPIRSAIPARLQQLRQAMQAQGVHAVLVPSADPHLSEYLPEHWQGRQHFSGFTGSMGTLVVRLILQKLSIGVLHLHRCLLLCSVFTKSLV